MKTTKILSSVMAATLIGLGSSGIAVAQTLTARANITNNVGSTISEDSGTSCSPSGSISAPSISNGSSGTATGSSTNSSMTCFFRYQNATGADGCQFEIQVTSTGGAPFANAYKGSGGHPTCTSLGGSFSDGTFTASFTMQ